MKKWLVLAGLTCATVVWSCERESSEGLGESAEAGKKKDPIAQHALNQLEEGKRIFRFSTFGDEAFWGGALRLHETIATVTPEQALGLGLKVDSQALPKSVVKGIQKGTIRLDDPATTLALLKLDAVVGVTGFFDESGALSSIGIQCALCHSTVDDSFDAGIGRRLDGWPNRDLDVGTIIALAPDLSPFETLLGVDRAAVEEVLHSWGPGRFDAELILDGKAFRPQDGKTAATLLPAAFGLAGVNLHTYTGWGGIAHWNALVANLEMHGSGTFYDPRLDDAEKFPIAAREGFGNVRNTPDLITPELSALHFYQLALPIPSPPEGSFDPVRAKEGESVFANEAKCATCHVPPIYTEPGWNMHTAEEIGIDDFQAMRSPDGRYRTTPLRGLFTRSKGGFYHDGRFPTLEAVVDHYVAHFELVLSPEQRQNLVEFLKSL